MSTSTFNYIEQEGQNVPSADGLRFGIVASEWNNTITDSLLQGAVNTLKKYGASDESIIIKRVPGSFELIFGSSKLVKSGLVDVVIAIGCVIRGDTPHFDFICQGVSQGIAELNTRSNVPVVFGLLTTNNPDQAEERSGGTLGNKGDEYAVTAIKLGHFAHQFMD